MKNVLFQLLDLHLLGLFNTIYSDTSANEWPC